MSSGHTCDALLVLCIDFRIQHFLHDFFLKKFPGGYDVISLAGGIKSLAEEAGKSNVIWQNVEISNRLHEPKQIVLIQHEDCGAYGGSRTFPSFEAEKQFQKEQLLKAKSILQETFAQPIHLYMVRLSGEILSLEE